MKTSDALYAAAEYIAMHGFSPKFGEYGRARCMLGALYSVGVLDWSLQGPAKDALQKVVGNNFFHGSLRGWNADDAIAALHIAADIAHVAEAKAAKRAARKRKQS